jgi:1-acyl-sn-glycerol-3-phosphate acyltransferase
MNRASPRHDGVPVSLFAHLVGRAFLSLAGWKAEGQLPAGGKGVLIAAPHTSGWDLPFMLATAWVLRVDIRWMGKHTLFAGFRGPIMRWLGGIPVDRRAPHGVVAQIAARFAAADTLFLAIAPAGTRSRVPRWHSGFYHIAHAAEVPIVCGFLDYGRKIGGVGPAFVPTGDIRADMDRIRAFYADMKGYHPDVTVPMVLREELGVVAPEAPLASEHVPEAPAPVDGVGGDEAEPRAAPIQAV